MSIHFFSEKVDFQLKDQSKVVDWLKSVTHSEKKALDQIEYIFCSDEYLLGINTKHLDHNYYTDIITFPLNYDPIEATVYISIDRVMDNAKQFEEDFVNELHRVIAHGLLHMIGYNDKTDDEKRVMREKENQVLSMRSFVKN